MSMKYCGITRVVSSVRAQVVGNVFNPKDEPYKSLGDQILEAFHYGSDIGSPAVVNYDPADVESVDVMTDPNHDFFDIAEQYGEAMVPPPTPVSDEPSE